MALFVVRHQHAAERCPAQDPYLGAMLLNHLSRPNVRRHGVKIQGEAIVQGEHTLYFIAEADDESRLAGAHAAVPAGRQRGYLSGVDVRPRRRQRRLRGAAAGDRAGNRASIRKTPASRRLMPAWWCIGRTR